MSKFTWQRAVVKVGSALLAPQNQLDQNQLTQSQITRHQYLHDIAKFIVASKAMGKEVIVVSSGAIALAKPNIKTGLVATISEKQAMAAIGQSKLMATWSQLFIQHDTSLLCGQMLLTIEDLANRERFVNIKNTLDELLKNNVIPIINENDTVAVDQIKVGDNDNLAAHTAIAAQADSLIIFTDVDGLYTKNPREHSDANLLSKIDNIDQSIFSLAGGAGTSVGTGGMITKLEAAHKCTTSGIQTLLLNGTNPDALKRLENGECSGTLFTQSLDKKTARQDWLAHTSTVKGSISLDKGAAKALINHGASLLAAGVVEIEGNFNAGDGILLKVDNKACAKGLVNYSSTELSRILGCKSDKIEEILGYTAGESVVHRDNVVLL